MNRTQVRAVGPLVGAVLALGACEGTMTGNDGGTGAPDGGNVARCEPILPAAEVICEAPACEATEGTKRFGEATLDSADSTSWVVPIWATSEVAGANDNATVDYTSTTEGGLTARGRGHASLAEQRAAARARTEAFLGPDAYAQLFRAERVERIRAEAAIRAMQRTGADASGAAGATGTAIRGRTRELLPPGVLQQSAACSAAAPSCGATSLCVIPEGASDGTCETAVALKFRTDSTSFEMVNATVRRVGTYGAILIDDADAASLSEADATELLDRFDRHIAPLDHQFFGEPRDAQGRDRDGNGVVIFFLTKRVAARGGAALVGYFQSDDLLPSAQERTSNAADILYMQPPGGTISMNAISGTIGHEYQHLINYYQKKLLRDSGPEDVWLDEGISSFAEDMLGYGGDAFENIAAYLASIDQTSLTGQGLLDEEDSSQRRGMAHLLVRYVFEQGGGATFASPGMATDGGGIAAVEKLVQSADTGTLLFTTATTGRTFHEWVGDLFTTIAVDGAEYPDVSCNPRYSLIAPETDAFTQNQRGIDLRTSFLNTRGQSVDLMGPLTATFGDDSGIIIPTNGGEIRTVAVSAGTVKITVSGSVDYEVGFRPVPSLPAE